MRKTQSRESRTERDCLATEMRSMNNHRFQFPRFLILSIFALTASATLCLGQTNEPDARIKAEMIAYLGKIENAAGLERPRVINKQKSVLIGDSKSATKN